MEIVGYFAGQVRCEAHVPIEERDVVENEPDVTHDEVLFERETEEDVKSVVQKAATVGKANGLMREAGIQDVEKRDGRVLARMARAAVGSGAAKNAVRVGYETVSLRYA